MVLVSTNAMKAQCLTKVNSGYYFNFGLNRTGLYGIGAQVRLQGNWVMVWKPTIMYLPNWLLPLTGRVLPVAIIIF